MHIVRLLSLPLVCLLSTSAHAVVVGINFIDSSGNANFNDTAGVSGLFWNGWSKVVGGTTTLANLQLGDNSGLSGISATAFNGPGFGRSGSPTVNGTAYVAGGYTFPNATASNTTSVLHQGWAENASSGRDNLVQVRFSVPVTSQLASWTFVAVGGDNSEPDDFIINVGGTWDAVNKVFAGGTSVLVQPDDTADGSANYGAGILASIPAEVVGSNYEIVFQFGGVTSTSSAATLRALVVETVPIPEPSSLSFVGALVVGLIALSRSRARNSAGVP